MNFGDVLSGQHKVARWQFSSSLQGEFTDYDAIFKHVSVLNDQKLSIIKNVDIHELEHIVYADGDYDDGAVDFLVNDVEDAHDLPDTLYLSDGTIEPVTSYFDLVADSQVQIVIW